MNVDEEVSAYIAIRDAREQLLHEYEAKDAELKILLSRLESEFLSVCNKTDANSINTNAGTIIRKLSERFTCNEWDNFRKFEQDNFEYDFREKRIHQGTFKQFLAEHKQDGLPPGVNVMREFGITGRRPS